jgi:NAD-dependent deacetylase
VEDVATPEGFARDPALVQAFYTTAAASCKARTSRPMRRIRRWRGWKRRWAIVSLVTQNIDNLHERAGNRRVIHMHGELLKVRCRGAGRCWSGPAM